MIAIKKFYLLSFITGLLCFSYSPSLWAKTVYMSYQVKTNDTVISILKFFKLIPIYGEGSYLQQTLNLNPHLKSTYGNRIYPQEWLKLPLITKPSDRSPSMTTSPKKSLHNFAAGLDYTFLTLHAYDPLSNAYANIYTTSNFGLYVQFHQNWTAFFNSYLEFRFSSMKFAPSSNPLRSLAQDSINPVHFVLGFQHKVSPFLDIGYFLNYGHQLFIRGLNTNQVMLDGLPLPSVGLSSKIKLLTTDDTVVGLTIDGRYFFSQSNDNYLIDAGWGANLSPFISYGSPSEIFYKLYLGYQIRFQNTSLVELENKELTGGLSILFNPFQRETLHE